MSKQGGPSKKDNVDLTGTPHFGLNIYAPQDPPNAAVVALYNALKNKNLDFKLIRDVRLPVDTVGIVDGGEKPEGSWWQTLPGILTAIGGIITAITGLLVVQYQSTPSRVSPGKPPPQPVHEDRERPVVPVATPPAVDRPYNMSFDTPTVGRQPPGWFNGDGIVDKVSTAYEIRVIPRPDGGNGTCVLFQNPSATKDEFGTVMQRFPALYLAGKTIRLEGEVKTKSVKEWAGLWLRADDDDDHTLFIDNMENRPIRGTTAWTKYTIDVELPRETVWLNYGILLLGPGTMWADNFRLMVWNIEKGEWTEL